MRASGDVRRRTGQRLRPEPFGPWGQDEACRPERRGGEADVGSVWTRKFSPDPGPHPGIRRATDVSGFDKNHIVSRGLGWRRESPRAGLESRQQAACAHGPPHLTRGNPATVQTTGSVHERNWLGLGSDDLRHKGHAWQTVEMRVTGQKVSAVLLRGGVDDRIRGCEPVFAADFGGK